MAEVESFTLDHTAVKAPYVRLINVEAGPKGDQISNFDVRLLQPNAGEIPTSGLHTIEHLLASLLRDRIDGVIDCYMADNGAGMTVTAGAGGYGGTVEVMIGIDPNGAITGVTVTNHSETPGLGTKAMTEEYLSQYNGVSEVAGDDIRKDSDIDAISGATLTSDAVYVAVGAALDQFKECGGVN